MKQREHLLQVSAVAPFRTGLQEQSVSQQGEQVQLIPTVKSRDEEVLLIKGAEG